MAAAITSKDNEEALQPKRGESKVFSKLFTRESSASAPSFRVYYGVASAGSVPFLWESQPGTPKNDAAIFSTAGTLQPPLTPPPSYYTARQQQQAVAPPHGLSRRHRRNRSSSSTSSSTAAAAAATGKNKKLSMSTKHYISIFSAMLPKMILHRRWPSRSRSSSAASSGSSPSAPSSSSSWSALSSFSAASGSSSLSLSSFRRSAQSPAACSSMTMRSRVFAFSAADDDGGSEEEEEQAAAPMCFSVVRHESFRAFRGCRVAMTVKSALSSVGGHAAAAVGPTAAQKV